MQNHSQVRHLLTSTSTETTPRAALPPLPHQFLNGEFHDWYQIVLGYSDHLVDGLINDFALKKGQTVLDPFCGTGTTLVECMKRGVTSVGVDANPSSIFAARVKTRWTLDGRRLLSHLPEVEQNYLRIMQDRNSLTTDPTHKYLKSSGMLARGWISSKPLQKAIALKRSILLISASQPYKEALLLALISEIVRGASNVKFGPELYCVPPKKDSLVLEGLISRVYAMAEDLKRAHHIGAGTSRVLFGDSRESSFLRQHCRGPFDAVICSPPYPTEHDYTRNSRLELAFLEAVVDLDSLRAIKKQMLRSHTKGIYQDQSDVRHVARNRRIQQFAETIDARARAKTDGFARLYGRVVREYFGGMRRHFHAVRPRLKSKALCAYVVGDQSSYLGVHIPTAELLADVARLEGFRFVALRHWRGRRSSTTLKNINENVLILEKTA